MSGETADLEAAKAAEAYRRRVRRAAVTITVGIVAALCLSALLPSTAPADRSGLLIGAATVALSALAWYRFVPRHWFKSHRVLAAGLVAQGSLVVVLALTGGVRSAQFAYYLLPVLAQIFSGDVRGTAIFGGIATGAVLAIAVGQAAAASDAAVIRDLAVMRVLELATITAFACIAAATIGATRRELGQRTSALAAETEANYRLAITDQLTGLHNRRFMTDAADRLIAGASRRGQRLTVVVMDVDGLKHVNDTLGHAAGDQVLRAIGEAIREQLRTEDVGVRLGGDEFVALLSEADAEAAAAVGKRIVSSFRGRTSDVGAGLTFGVASWAPGMSAEVLLHEGDRALYRAKQTRSAASGSRSA